MVECRVLVVDDSHTMRQLISFALHRIKGIQIVQASDGVEGLKKLTEGSFDLIFTDINMPVMDGLKLLGMIRSNEKYHDIPVVVITTEGAQEDRARALALGATDYVTKPIQPNRILDLAKNLLNLP